MRRLINNKRVKERNRRGISRRITALMLGTAFAFSVCAVKPGSTEAYAAENDDEYIVADAEKTDEKTEATTIKGFLKTGLKPLGTTMYIYGGGWNEEDTGAGDEGRTIGLSPKWAEFAAKQNSSYNYKDYDYKKDVSVIHNGLDCSGYLGWVLYNTLETEDGNPGYVDYNNKVFFGLESKGYGTMTAPSSVKTYKPGDIMTSSSHMWIVLGSCSDGSVVILHSSPPGVQINGTPTPSGRTNSEAVSLAKQYMSTYYSSWYSRFPNVSKGMSYLSGYYQFRWNVVSGLTDPDGYQDMTAEEVLADLFGETKGKWKSNATGWWFEYSDGTYPASKWEEIKGVWYYFNKDGYMMTGWQQQGGIWYYLDPSGAMVTGWKQIKGIWYYMRPDGAMHTGWLQDGSTWYFMNSDGAMMTGWIQSGNDWYYMKTSGAMACSETINGYRLDATGKWVK